MVLQDGSSGNAPTIRGLRVTSRHATFESSGSDLVTEEQVSVATLHSFPEMTTGHSFSGQPSRFWNCTESTSRMYFMLLLERYTVVSSVAPSTRAWASRSSSSLSFMGFICPRACRGMPQHSTFSFFFSATYFFPFSTLGPLSRDRGRERGLLFPSLRTGLADFPHPALQLEVLPSYGLACFHIGII